MHKRGGNRPREDGPMVQVSKTLSYLLRHGAEQEGLSIDKEGFVPLGEILAKDFFKSRKITEKEVKEVVESNEKKRFELKTTNDKDGTPVIYIRASQGHTIKSVEDEGLLKKVNDASEIPMCLHGTNKDAWEFIRRDGLKPMQRNHIHFAGGFPGENGVISGMRQSCTVFIEVDTEKAMKDGIEFYVSGNNVILSRGINGVISPKYFKKVSIKEKGGLKEVDPKLYFAPSIESSAKPEEKKEEIKLPGKTEEEAKLPEKKVSAQSADFFKYLCILDFEAQCKNNERLSVQEIIELPVVIVDVENKTILEDKFHYYIKPVVHPQLYDFCKQLTGITQDQVNNGILLKEALDKLDTFLQEKGILNSNFMFVTCGDWDLNTCLKNEATKKNIPVRDYLKSWINLKKFYPVPFGSSVKNPDMVKMLELSKLELIGKHHSGIDDAQNIARVAVYLLQKNFKFTPTMAAKANY